MSDKSDGGVTLNVTLNGPIFGVFATICVWAIGAGFLWLAVVTEGLAFLGLIMLLLAGCILFIFGWATWEFYRWAARGFKSGW